MLQFLSDDPIMYLKRQNELLKLFVQKAKPILEKLHVEFNQYKDLITVKDIDGNTFQFTLWGLDFIVKTEIKNDKDNHLFLNGELNIYYIQKEEEVLITTFLFDKLGNIEGKYLFDDFSLPFFRQFIEQFIDYAQNNTISFQLTETETSE